jgi:hypothetical protein
LVYGLSGLAVILGMIIAIICIVRRRARKARKPVPKHALPARPEGLHNPMYRGPNRIYDTIAEDDGYLVPSDVASAITRLPSNATYSAIIRRPGSITTPPIHPAEEEQLYDLASETLATDDPDTGEPLYDLATLPTSTAPTSPVLEYIDVNLEEDKAGYLDVAS